MKIKTPEIKEFKVFVPCGPKGIEESIAFYQDLGFSVASKNGNVCCINTNQGAKFLISDKYNKDLAENLMLHIWVEKLHEWRIYLDSLKLKEKYPRVKISKPKDEPWGLTVIYLWDPAGVLIHIAEPTSTNKII